MSTTNQELTSVLNDLIATCNDSWEAFGKAAKGVHDDQFRNWLTDVSLQRAGFARRLSDEVRKAGGDPAQEGHGGGILHRGWVDLETRLRSKNDGEIRTECIRGEESTLKHYERAVEQNMPDEVRLIVERQFNEVQATLKELREGGVYVPR
jgi:uncharacterized protein (TIGR02284 family)